MRSPIFSIQENGEFLCLKKVCSTENEPFQHKIISFLSSFGLNPFVDKKAYEIEKAIVLYAVGLINNKQFRVVGKKHDILERLVVFKQHNLRNSQIVLLHLNRALMHYFGTGKILDKKKSSVLKSDVLYCARFINKTQARHLRSLENKSKTFMLDRLVFDKQAERLLSELTPFICSRVNKKLSFIYKHDAAFERSDFISELKAVAIKNIYKYAGQPKLFAKKAVFNKIKHEIVTIINKHTSIKRKVLYQNLKSSETKTQVKIHNLKTNKIRYHKTVHTIDEPSYSKIVSSLNDTVKSSESSEGSSLVTYLQSLIADSTQKDPCDEYEEQDTMQKLLKYTKHDQRLTEFVEIVVFGKYPPRFSLLLEEQQQNSYYSRRAFKSILVLAREYLGFSKRQLAEAFTPVFRKVGLIAYRAKEKRKKVAV